MSSLVEGTTRAVGSSVLRVEDVRILTGRGRYADDVVVPGMAHAAFVRSTVPHADLCSVVVDAARAMPGVAGVFTGADVAARLAPMSPKLLQPGFRFEPVPALAVDRVRFVGDPIAIVIAETRALAEDAAELIEVEYRQRRPIVTADDAHDPEGDPLFDSIGSNVVLSSSVSGGADVGEAMQRAPRIVRATMAAHRVAPVPMEGRGGVAEYDRRSRRLVFHATTQSPHGVRLAIAEALGIDVGDVDVVNGDIGGAFGLKISTHREEIALCAAAWWLQRSVKWTEDRVEHLLAAGQAREETVVAEAAVDHDGAILALRVGLTQNIGAYTATPSPGAGTSAAILRFLPGPYAIPAYSGTADVVVSNKATHHPYRGPWAMETYARERILNAIALDLGLDPAEVRRRNLLDGAPGDRTVMGLDVSGVTARESLDRVLEIADYESLRLDQAEARALGRYRGIGFATFIEAAPGPNPGRGRQQAKVRLEADGTLAVFTTETPNGQGHETTLAQIAADAFGVDVDRVRVHHGDTRTTPFALIGSGGSRGSTMGGGSVFVATRTLRSKVLEIAATRLEASPDDLVVERGVVSVLGSPTVQLPLAELAKAALFAPQSFPAGMDVTLEATGAYDGGRGGWSGGTHLCHVEVDVDTGVVEILRYVVVEDCGTVIHPGIANGQIRGGVAQGIGEVLYEHAAYTADGNPTAVSFLDYLLPTASEIPPIEIHHLATVDPGGDEIGYRGIGEGGMIVAPATLVNAIEDALQPFGVRTHEQYLPPSRILELIGRC